MNFAARLACVSRFFLTAWACWITPVAAATCIDDDWQPSLVYDFDNDDGVYYVTATGYFQKLQWQSNGGYGPAVCSIIRGPQDLRDARGFTTCQQYARIQCGCSREVPGNRTCAAFLKWHPAATETRDNSSPTKSRPTAIAVSVPLSSAWWRRAPQYQGTVSAGTSGLVVRGGAWTNGQLRNGFLDGNRIYSNETFNFSSGGDGYIRFAANGNGQYMSLWPRVLENVSVGTLTTHHSWARSVVVPENTWLFAHLRVNKDGSYRIAVALGNYDDLGGRVITERTGRLDSPRGRLDLQFGDNYGGTAAVVTIGEAKVVIAPDQ